MRVDSTQISQTTAGGPQDFRVPKDPVAAAKQFEEVLVREFVRTMTKDMFSGSLAGEDGAGWVKAQGEAQSDTLTDVVTKHLVESGTLGISDMLLRKWNASPGAADEMARVFELNQDKPMSIERFMQLNANPLAAPDINGGRHE